MITFNPQPGAARHAAATAIRQATVGVLTQKYRGHSVACSQWYIIVAPFNYCALMALNDAVAAVQFSPKWKKKGIRTACKECQRLADRYENKVIRATSDSNMGSDIGRSDFVMDYLDSFQDEWQHDLFILRMCISNFLLKVRYTRDVELASYVFTAYNVLIQSVRFFVFTAYNVLIQSVRFFDMFIDGIKKRYGVDIRAEFYDGRLQPIVDALKVVAQSLDTPEAEELHTDKNTHDALQALANRISSQAVAEKAAGEALKINPDVMQWAKDNEGIIERDVEKQEKKFRKLAGLE